MELDEGTKLILDINQLTMDAAKDFALALNDYRQTEVAVAVGTEAGVWTISAKLEPKEH
jgi:hypothetical protein